MPITPIEAENIEFVLEAIEEQLEKLDRLLRQSDVVDAPPADTPAAPPG